jgi:hypothetical protein
MLCAFARVTPNWLWLCLARFFVVDTPLAHYTPSVSTVADLKKYRRVRAKDHLFLIIR